MQRASIASARRENVQQFGCQSASLGFAHWPARPPFRGVIIPKIDRGGWKRPVSRLAGGLTGRVQHSAGSWRSSFPTDDKARQTILGLNLCSSVSLGVGSEFQNPPAKTTDADRGGAE
jgi:hypothetical protein